MKVPSIVRLPRHKKFNFEPRYYDPVKEDIANRTARLKQEMSQTHNELSRINMSGYFARRERENRNISLLQLTMIVLLFGLTFGYIYYGSIVFYALWAVVPVYLYFRLKKFIRRS
jgi:hypothetical protein